MEDAILQGQKNAVFLILVWCFIVFYVGLYLEI